MATSKLPPYFERYFEDKFGGITRQIDDLKLHVNDENEKLVARLGVVEGQVIKIWLAIVILTPIYIKDSRDILFNLLKSGLGI